MDVLEGSLSRTKGFIVISYLKTIEHLKTKNIAVNQVTLIHIHIKHVIDLD